jgi:hypothetical protein
VWDARSGRVLLNRALFFGASSAPSAGGAVGPAAAGAVEAAADGRAAGGVEAVAEQGAGGGERAAGVAGNGEAVGEGEGGLLSGERPLAMAALLAEHVFGAVAALVARVRGRAGQGGGAAVAALVGRTQVPGGVGGWNAARRAWMSEGRGFVCMLGGGGEGQSRGQALAGVCRP